MPRLRQKDVAKTLKDAKRLLEHCHTLNRNDLTVLIVTKAFPTLPAKFISDELSMSERTFFRVKERYENTVKGE